MTFLNGGILLSAAKEDSTSRSRMDPMFAAFAIGFFGQLTVLIVRLRPTLRAMQLMVQVIVEPRIGRRNTELLLTL